MAGEVKGAAKVAARLEELFKGENGGVKGSKAEEYVREYYTRDQFYGSAFDDTLTVPYQFTEQDLLRLSLLSVPASGSIVRDLQRGFFTEPLDECGGVSLNALLAEIPQNLAFEDLDDEEFQNHLAVGSPADTLWKAITKISPTRNWEMGQTSTSKLLAAKRPHLIPIYDSVVEKAFGKSGSADHWTDMRELFTQDEDLASQLRSLSKLSGKRVSVIRLLDVVLWMDGRKGHSKVD